MHNWQHDDLYMAYEVSSRHRQILQDSTLCGCFYCLETFQYTQIQAWTDLANTAICPYCGIDAVIGSASGYPINAEFLKAMHVHWF